MAQLLENSTVGGKKIVNEEELASKEDALPADRKRKITFGTSEPSGGNDGDIYFQYE